MTNFKDLKYVFLGTGTLAKEALLTLIKRNYKPSLIITTINKKVGRGLKENENEIIKIAKEYNINYWQPETLKDIDFKNTPLKENFDLAIVASYPKILSEKFLNLFKDKVINIHPSLLPFYRGPSPIQTALLNGDDNLGISIMQIDKEMDHGGILIQKSIPIQEVETNLDLEIVSGKIGGEMIIEIIDDYLNQKLIPVKQDHSKATYTYKFQKADGEIALDDKASEIQNKYKAFIPHISLFFFIHNKHNNQLIRIKVSEVNLNKEFAKDKLAKDIILKVIPEGKKEISFSDFEKGYLS